MPANDAAYFCTDCAGTSDTWTQDVACDGTNVDMTIVYKFASAKTVQAQLTDCADYGCVVDFTVSGDDFTTTSFTSNNWMFTDASVFSGSKVSPDDGIWGAAPGEVNGNGDCYGDGYGYGSNPNGFYGFGNCNSGDGSSTVYYGPDGTHSCSSLKAWVYAGASPPPPVPLTNGVNGADGCGAGKCDRCEGDCDSDSDCKAGLTCFQRSGYVSVPGCSGGGTSGYDYCWQPTSPTPGVLSLGVHAMDGCGAGKCDECQGDCDTDSDCKAGLTCFQRDTGSVPGCSGVATTDWDYCIPE